MASSFVRRRSRCVDKIYAPYQFGWNITAKMLPDIGKRLNRHVGAAWKSGCSIAICAKTRKGSDWRRVHWSAKLVLRFEEPGRIQLLMNDLALIEQIRQRDQEAMVTLHARYADLIYSIVYRI